MPVKNNDIRNRLKKLVGKDNILLVKSGNKAIMYALRFMKSIGKEKLLIQDQGGWITYTQYAKRLKIEIIKLKTDYGLIDLNDLDSKADDKSCLIYNSMTGYFALQDSAKIYDVCKKKGCIVINDVSGSIGHEEAKHGDMIVCSLGEGKPINYGRGGFLAFNNEALFEKMNGTEINIIDLNDDERVKLFTRIAKLSERLAMLEKVTTKVKDDLKDLEIIHKDKFGINVVVKFKGNTDKKKIIDYCKKEKLEFEECPRNIRVEAEAICIEVKRKV